MDVILDSNIYFSDFKLRSIEISLLTDYLKTSNSKLLIPSVVYEEINANYRKEHVKRTNSLRDGAKHLKLQLFNIELVEYLNKMDKFKIDFDTELELYKQHLEKTLNINSDSIIRPNDSIIEQLIKRAVYRTKPFDEKGNGFRDSLIWLTIIDHLRKLKNSQIVFISNNHNDFASKDISQLHQDLKNDMVNIKGKIHYYKTISEFIADKFGPILDIELNLEQIDEDEIKHAIKSYIVGSSDAALEKYFLKETYKKRFLEFVDIHFILDRKLLTKRFYEIMDDEGSYYISFDLTAKISFILAFEYYSESIINTTDGPELDYNIDYELDEIIIPCKIGLNCKFSKGNYNEVEAVSFELIK